MVPEMSLESFIDRVELLKKVGKLKFHFRPSPASSSLTSPPHCPIELYSTKESIILAIQRPTHKKDDVEPEKDLDLIDSFSIELPFEFNITTLNDNIRIVKRDPSLRRVIALGFEITSKEKTNFDLIETDLDDLDEHLSQIWDAKYFQTVENIVCLNCESFILTRLTPKELDGAPATSIPIEAESTDVNREDSPDTNPNLPTSSPNTSNSLPEEEAFALDLSNLTIKDSPIDTTANPVACSDAKQALFTRFRNLPNEGWEELVDCWVCHSEDYTPQFSKLFCPNPYTLLVGANYLLINISRLPSASVSDDNKVGRHPHKPSFLKLAPFGGLKLHLLFSVLL